jgi:hypothetical protein
MRTHLTVAVLGVALLSIPCGVSAQDAAPAAPRRAAQPTEPLPMPGEWTGPRTPDGQPDIHGVYDTSAISGSWALENPMAGGGRFPYLAAGKEPPKNPSRVIDPPDGKVPYQAWALKERADQEAHVEDPQRPEHLDTQIRCLLQGPARGFYTTQARFTQGPGYVLVNFDQYAYFRVIRLNAPHVGKDIKLWMGDSVGHWEGNTLVVDVTNVNAKARLSMIGDFYDTNAHFVERLTFGKDVINYKATIEDPTVLTRPYTIGVPMKRVADYEFWEYACHEGEKTSGHIDSTFKK